MVDENDLEGRISGSYGVQGRDKVADSLQVGLSLERIHTGGQWERINTEIRELLTGPALVGNSLCPGQEEHTMRETEVQIGNSC
jgi:hypothetical protein